jgi:hypothetical protein
MIPKNILCIAAIAWLLTGVLTGQQSLVQFQEPDLNKLAREDLSFNNARFSAPLPLDIAPASAPDTYAYENGEWTWSRTFQVPSATGLALFADRLNLPEGGRLLLTNRAGSRGPFTQADASTENRLFTDFLPGETVTLTYYGPLPDETPFHLWRVDHVYRTDLWRNPFEKDFEDSNSCQVNANCTAGDGWEDEKSGAARINLVVAEGVGFCSGNLINNTAQDGRPFILTGFHCMDGFTPIYDLWAIDFDYTSDDCTNPITEPTPTRYVGVRFRAGKRETDFMLLEIIDPAFTAEDHYFAGWDRSPGDVSGEIIHFHHPVGDIQKLGVSGSEGMTILTNQITWNNGVVTPPSHHFVMDYAVGDFEQGSSGSAYFDQDHRIRGQLNGGNSSCPGVSEAFVGRFHLSWDQGLVDSSRLQPWLDPVGNNPMTFDGQNLLTKVFLQGSVRDANDLPLEGVSIALQWEGGGLMEFTTDASGNYRGERPAGVQDFAVSGQYRPDGPLDEGVDVGDIITIRRDILGFSEMTPVERLAGDTNNSGTIRVSDITRITRVILAIGDWGSRPNWLVIPVGFPLEPIPVDPQLPIGISINSSGVREVAVDFFVVKTGDANLSVGE